MNLEKDLEKIKEILKTIFLNEGEGNNILIIRKIRLPMSLMAIVVGFSLGIGGCEIQTILKNPIASPYTLGITSAASFGAALALVLNNSILKLPDTLAVTGNAFFFTFLIVPPANIETPTKNTTIKENSLFKIISILVLFYD